MSSRLGLACALVSLAGCDPPTAEPAPAVAASVAPQKVASASPSARERAKAPKRAAKPKLARLKLDSDGRWRGELAPAKRSVYVVLATKERPLAPHPPAAYHGIAELVTPGLVPSTRLTALPLSELLQAAEDDRTRRAIGKQARVLGDGTVYATLIDAPKPALKTVDLADLVEGRRAWKWESKLVVKAPPPAEQASVLAAYQKLLAVDYLVENLARREVLLDESVPQLVAVDDNDAFSPRGHDGAVGDAMHRLSAHLVFSASLAERLEKLDKARAERALRGGPDDSLLVTPKQVDDVIERKRSLDKLLATRIRQRGRERALALP